MKNNKGFTVVEMGISFCLIFTIAILLFQILLSLKEIYINSNIKTTLLIKQGIVINKIYSDLESMSLENITSCGDQCYKLQLKDENGTPIEKQIMISSQKFVYGDYTWNLGNSSNFENLKVEKKTIEDEYLTIHVSIKNSLIEKEDFGFDIVWNLSDQVTTLKTYSNGTAIYFNPITTTTCSVDEAVSTDGTKTGCMKWYAFNDTSSSNTINLILDHNTDSMNPWSTETITTTLNNLVANSKWAITPRLIEADEIAKITGNTSFHQESATSSDNFYFDTNTSTASPTCSYGNTSNCQYGWLYDRVNTNCVSFGCLNNSNLSDYAYWTSTLVADSSSTKAWAVVFNGMLNSYDIAPTLSMKIRPVITVSKTMLD